MTWAKRLHVSRRHLHNFSFDCLVLGWASKWCVLQGEYSVILVYCFFFTRYSVSHPSVLHSAFLPHLLCCLFDCLPACLPACLPLSLIRTYSRVSLTCDCLLVVRLHVCQREKWFYVYRTAPGFLSTFQTSVQMFVSSPPSTRIESMMCVCLCNCLSIICPIVGLPACLSGFLSGREPITGPESAWPWCTACMSSLTTYEKSIYTHIYIDIGISVNII